MSDSKIDILLLGSGGREHALLTKLVESPRAGKMWVAPGQRRHGRHRRGGRP